MDKTQTMKHLLFILSIFLLLNTACEKAFLGTAPENDPSSVLAKRRILGARMFVGHPSMLPGVAEDSQSIQWFVLHVPLLR